MANVYSTKFAEVILALAEPTLLYTVPAGFTAVIRDMYATQNGSSLYGLVGIQVYTGASTQLWNVLHPQAVSTVTYHWEGRKVMNPGDELFATASDPNWSLDVSGFLLTLP